MYDLETTLRAALARRGITLRCVELVQHIDCPEYAAIVLTFEGRRPVFDVYSAFDFADPHDIECWVYCHYGPVHTATEGLIASVPRAN